MLQITRQQFKQIYGDTVVSGYEKIFYSEPISDDVYVTDYLPSKLWRLNNLYSIINKEGSRVKFNMNLAQHKVYAASLKHPRIIILKSRQQGISTLWLIAFFDDCVFYSDFSSGLMAQGNDEAEKLLNRTKILWEDFPEAVKNFLNIDIIKNNTREFSFTNGSALFVRTSFRSTTLQRLHISEFGKIANSNPDRAKETKTGTLQAIAPSNTVVIESTGEGENDFKRMWENAVEYAGKRTPKDFLPVFLPWYDDPDCNMDVYQEPDAVASKYFTDLQAITNVKLTESQKNFWVASYRELGKDIYQEYPATPEEAFLRNRDGTYYAAQYMQLIRGRGREISGLFDPNLPVQVAVDLGRNDFFVLTFFQTFTDGYRIIDDYHNSGHGIRHYCQVMKDKSRDLGYDIELIILPHDAAVNELTSDITREESFWENGFHGKTTVLERPKSIENDRELVRRAMDKFWIDPKAQYIINCFLNYSRQWDKMRGVWKEEHLHNDYSHGMDSIRALIKGAIEYTPQEKRRRQAYSTYSNSGMDV